VPVPPRPVGGSVMPTNKLEIMAPFLALAGLVAVVSAVVVVKRRKD
jgi:LPXTG-motif cell wall-anchored protein